MMRRRCLATRAVTALVFLTLSPTLHASGNGAAVPEFIVPAEAESETPASAELARAQDAFRASLGKDAARAIEIAKDVVALARGTYADPHDHIARALTNLAIVQAEDANFSAAIENYMAAIEMRERASGSIVSPDLINPLRGLAGAFMALDDVELAIPALERAIHISHVNAGPENLDQVEIIDDLSRAYFFNGELDKAGDLQNTIFRLRERRSEEDPEQFLDALEQRSQWFVRLGQYDKAVVSYRRLKRTISAELGNEDPRLIEPLVELADALVRASVGVAARSGGTASAPRIAGSVGGPGDPRTYRALVTEARRCDTTSCAAAIMGQGTTTGVSAQAFREGRIALSRAVRIARIHAETQPERLARTLVKQGDWLVAMNQARDARKRYREAWEILDADPDLHGNRDRLFARPAIVTRAPIHLVQGQAADQPADRARYPERGYADIALDVDKRGKPRNVRVVSAEPAGLVDEHLEKQVRRFKFRPAYGKGKPRSFDGLFYRYTFRYDAEQLTAEARARIAATTYDADTPPPEDEDAVPLLNDDMGLMPRQPVEPAEGSPVT